MHFAMKANFRTLMAKKSHTISAKIGEGDVWVFG